MQPAWFQPAAEGMLQNAIPEAVAAMIHLESQWDQQKLEKKLREYFNKGAKNMEFRSKPLPALIDEYADNAMGSVFAGLGDREWLYTGQADFLLILDAGIKDNFPGHLLRQVTQVEFEQLVLAAYERAFDEQRFCPILTEAVGAAVSGPKITKKVWNAIDQGRKDTVKQGVDNVEDFTVTWIGTAIAYLSEKSQGAPEASLPVEVCSQLFQGLLENGGLPLRLTAEAEPPLQLVDEAVQGAYLEHTIPEDAYGQPAAKKQRMGGMPGMPGMGAFSAW